MKSIVKKYINKALLILVLTHSYHLAASEDRYSYLIKDEGISSIEIEGVDIGSFVDLIVEQKGNEVLSEKFYEKFIFNQEGLDNEVWFVLFMLSSAVNGQEDFAFVEYLSMSEDISLSVMDQKPESAKEVFVFSYNWLINNTNFVVPESFIETYPKLFDATVAWHATRDAYFKIHIQNEEVLNIINNAHLKLYFTLLDTANNPDGCFIGSIANYKYIKQLIETGLLLIRPDYLIDKVPATTRSKEDKKWLDYWRHGGELQEYLTELVVIQENNLKEILINYLTNIKHLNTTDADYLVSRYFSLIRNLYTGRTPHGYLDTHDKIMLQIVNEDNNLFKYLPERYQTDVVAGMMLMNGSDEYAYQYYVRLIEEANHYAADEFLELTSATSRFSLLIKLLKLDSYKHSGDGANTYGRFGKTPLMYAVQNDRIENYSVLALTHSDLLNYIIPASKHDCGPSIRGRSILTYALENASMKLINLVLSSIDPKLIYHEDSKGRNIFYYLSKNEKLKRKDKSKISESIFIRLNSIGETLKFPIHNASFDCHKASSNIELLTCSSKSFAGLDLKMSDAYASKINNTKSNDLLKTQRAWLRNRQACIQDLGYEQCYSVRISELSQ